MSCTVKRNSNKEITKVLNKNGQQSTLFRDIANHTAILDTEQALSVYKNIYIDALKDADESSMQLAHQVNGENFNSFKDALNFAKENQKISVGFIVEDIFTELLTVPKNTSLDSETGFVQNHLLNGNISENRVKVGNMYKLQAFGGTDVRKQASMAIIENSAKIQLGSQSINIDEYSFTLKKTKGISKIANKKGDLIEVSQSDLYNMSDQDVINTFENGAEILIEKLHRAEVFSTREVNTPQVKENSELTRNLISLLKKMGISVVSMTNYITNYTLRNGVNPNAEALADIANQVISITAGQETAENLLEETVHFIVEALPQERIENILRNIDKSEEYKQNYQIQKSIYESEYSAEELENVVRREILGKIITNAITQTEQKSETQQNFFENAKRLVQEFFQDIVNYFKPEYQIELNNLLQDVHNLITSQDVNNLDLNFQGNIMRLYSVAPTQSEEGKLFKATTNLITSLSEQEKSLRGSNIKNVTSVNRLREIEREVKNVQEELGEAIKINSVAGLLTVAQSRIAEIKAAIEDSENKGKLQLTSEEVLVFNSLTKKIQPELSILKSIILDTKKGFKLWEDLTKSIDSVVLDIADISAKSQTIDIQNTEKIVDELVRSQGIQNPNILKDWLTVVKKDTNLLLSTFGQMSAARDGMLNVLNFLTRNMFNEGREEFTSEAKILQKVMRENNVTAQDFSKLVDRGFIISSYDFPRFKGEMDALFIKKYREYSKTELKDEEILDSRRNKELQEFGDSQMQYERELKQLQDGLKERMFKDSYYTEYEDKMQKAGISLATKNYLSGYFSGLADIKLKSTKTVSGKIITDFSQLSLSDRERQKELQQSRRMAKSYVDGSGNLKRGLQIKQKDGVNELDDSGKLIYELLESASTDAVVAFELNKLDSLNDYKGMSMDNGIPKKFMDELKNIENTFGKEEALDFLRMNSHMSFKSSFWDNLGKSKKITEKLREALLTSSQVESIEIKELINKIESKNQSVKGILRVFVNKNSPIEVDAERIPSEAKDKIKILQEGLETDFSNAKKYTKNIVDLDLVEEAEDSGISTTNQAWKDLRIDLGINLNNVSNVEEVLKLITENTTSNNKDSINSADISIRQFIKGNAMNVSNSVEKELEKRGLTKEDLIDENIYSEFIISYAESKLLPYYKRFAPTSYTNFNETLEQSNSVSDFVLDLNKNYPSLEITPSPSYFDVQDNTQINPEFNSDFKGGYSQPNKTKFKNQNFYDIFGDDKGTKNPKLFKVYEAMMDLRIKTLDANSAGTGYNAYLLPQTRKNKVEKFTTFLKDNPTQNIKNAFQDMFNFTEDEQVRGDMELVKRIPQMYLSEIEPSDVSTELFYSLMLSAKESFVRKSRVKYYGDIISTLDTMKGRDYEATGKTAEATQTMKMARNAIDYSLFGVKETSTAPIKTPFGTVDGAKIARNLLGYVKLKNLGLNVVIPFTSYATGKLNTWTEVYIGQYFNKRSHKLGQAEYRRQLSDSAKEFGKVDTKANLNVYGQHYGSFDLDASFANSNYNNFGRNMVRTPMALHSLANYSIYGANMYSILHDYRFVEGKLMNFNEYRLAQKINNTSKADIENNWNSFEDKVVFNYTQNKDGQFQYLNDKIGQELGITGEQLQEEITNLNNRITNQISAVNSFIDGSISQEERTYAQRDAYLSYLTTHKGWLTIATQRRFKSRHINLETGQEEEGSYSSFWNFLGGYIKEYKDSGASGMIMNFKRAYEKGDDIQRANIIRVTKEMVILNSVIALLMILKGFADDPENKDEYTLQLATYLMYRISAETTSSNLGITSNYTEVLKSPLVGFDTIANLGNILDLAPGIGDDEITQGKYSGMSERGKFITTSFPGAKQIFDLYNINSTLDTYNLFNEKNLDFTVGSSLIWAEDVENKNNEE